MANWYKVNYRRMKFINKLNKKKRKINKQDGPLAAELKSIEEMVRSQVIRWWKMVVQVRWKMVAQVTKWSSPSRTEVAFMCGRWLQPSWSRGRVLGLQCLLARGRRLWALRSYLFFGSNRRVGRWLHGPNLLGSSACLVRLGGCQTDFNLGEATAPRLGLFLEHWSLNNCNL